MRMKSLALSSTAETPGKSREGLLYFGIFIVTFLLVFFAACLVTYMMPKKYESTAVIQVRPSIRALNTSKDSSLSTPHYDFVTKSEVITAQTTLKSVVRRLDLTTRWNITEDEAIVVLRQQTMVYRINDLIKVTVKCSDPLEARNIAMEIFLSYKKRREDKEREMVENSFKELEKAILDQSDVVEEKRKQRDNHLNRDSNSPEMDLTRQDVQSDYEVHRELLDRMREKSSILRIESKPSNNNLVLLHEEPVIAQFPSSPNVTLNLTIGAGLGAVLGAILALFVRLLRGTDARLKGAFAGYVAT